MNENRINKLKELVPSGLDVSFKDYRGKIYANCKGNSKIIRSVQQFNEWMVAMLDYREPDCIDLTSRLIALENHTINRYN